VSRPQLAALVLVLSALVAAPRSASSPIAADLAAALPRDGSLVFSCSGCPGAETGTRLFTNRPDGSRLRLLAPAEGVYEPRWSPDGRTIAFGRGFRTIWLARGDGSDARQLTRPIRTMEDSSPAWSADGGRVVFVRLRPELQARGERRTELRTIDANRTRPRRLLSASVNVVSPDWSPDGREIAFNDVEERMWVADANGSNCRRLGPKGLVGREPRWSPDGRRVAFVEFDSGTFRILDLRTGRQRTLLDFGSFSAHAWSLDGRWLALMRTTPVECGGPYECESLQLWIVSSTGTSRKLVFSVPDGGEVYGIDWRRRS